MAVARGELPNNTGFAGGDIPRASIVPPSESVSKYYVRTMVPDAPGVLRDLAGCMAAEGISIAQVIQKRDMEDVEFGEEVVPLVFMTHEASARAMRQALQHALDKGLLHSPAVYYRVL
jgi:homoserine dehydrogenase